ncbi:MAG TPA: hypothetical protein ENJ20_03035, partial [Bacteroidetes bacterium]|nr:hypothetical protein [Bacteroidota bacterium]
IEKHTLHGIAHLDVQADNIFKMEGLSTLFTINDLTVNGDNYGLLHLRAKALSIKERVDADLSLAGDTTSLHVKGFLNLPTYKEKKLTVKGAGRKNYFDFQADFNKIPVSIISYFVPAVLNPKGSISAKGVRVYGPFNRPEVEGKVRVSGISFKVKPIQTTYRVPRGEVTLTSTAIDATGNFVYDRFNNKALLNGGLVHDHLKNFGLNLTISTEKNRPFLGLQTTPEDNPVFYGTAIGTGWARFTGTFQQSELEVKARSMPGTHMYLPLTGSTIDEENRFIRFTEEERKKEEGQTPTVETPELRGLNMYFDIDLTPDAYMEVIFDRAWGDVLRGAVRGNIKVDFERNGNFEMFGNTNVVNGDYLFTLMNVGVNKSFTVESGGTVVWSGDPYNADIDIDAIYTGVDAPVFSFIQEYLSVASANTRDLARNPTPVLLKMNLSGKLLTPDIKFDFIFPELNGELKSLAENKLRTVRQDENELNRQVFGLLVLGQFLPSGATIQAGDVGFNTLSEMLSNQLSIFVTEWINELVAGIDIIKGIDVNFSVNRFTTEDINTEDLTRASELGGRVKVVFSDRIAVNVGTEYDIGGSLTTINSGQWAGEFEVEWALTKDHRLIFKGYHSRDPDVTGGRRNKTGAKILFRKEFDSIGELLEWAKKKKKKK